MLKLKSIHTNNAPKAVGPYSQAVITGNLIFCSGQIGLDPKTNVLKESVENQIRQIIQNISAVLTEAKSDLNHVVKTTIYVTDMNNYSTVNKIYGEYFNDHKPARATVEVSKLPLNALVEIEVVATKK